MTQTLKTNQAALTKPLGEEMVHSRKKVHQLTEEVRQKTEGAQKTVGTPGKGVPPETVGTPDREVKRWERAIAQLVVMAEQTAVGKTV